MLHKWETISKKEVQNLKIFRMNIVRRRHPVWNHESDFVVLDNPKWINIIPVTKDLKVICVEQYRHGIDDITLEVPGGLVEPDEDPLVAAERECLEETGFGGEGHAVLLGENQPNPAFLDNICYSYVWFGCERKSEQKLDGNEDINIVEVPLADIKDFIMTGKIKHSLVITAFFFYYMKYGIESFVSR
jgi:8-oxo-dGTP pyrophosphatase MutT (NUDIX family)